MADLIALALLSMGTLLSLVALFVVLAGLFPELMVDIRHVAHTRPGHSLGAGVINLIFALAVALALFTLAEDQGLDALGGLGLLWLALVGFGLALGLAAMAQLVGYRLNPEWPPCRRSLWGGLALILAGLAPGVGWLVLFPYVALLGFGSVILALWSRRARRPETE